MNFVECFDLITNNKVYINPAALAWIGEMPTEQEFVPPGASHGFTIPAGNYNAAFFSGHRLIVSKESGEKLLAAQPLVSYVVDAKTLFKEVT